jgi:hypothetical protein
VVLTYATTPANRPMENGWNLEIERAATVEKFRALAETFRRAASDPPREKHGWPALALAQSEKEAGALVMRAFRRGWLPKWDGLPELVEWVENPPEPDLKAQCHIIPCEGNLFSELCGLNQIPVFNTGRELKVTGDTCGGILPKLYPDVFRGRPFVEHEPGEYRWKADCDHKAACCGLLARIIEESRCAVDDDARGPAVALRKDPSVMAKVRDFPFEASILFVPCGPEGTLNAIPYSEKCVAGFRPSDCASEKWVITAPDALSGRNGAILYRSEMTIYGTSVGSFFVLVTCDPLGVKSLGVVLSAVEADELRRRSERSPAPEVPAVTPQLSGTEIHVLRILAKKWPAPMLGVDIEAADGCSRHTVSAIMPKMVNAGLVVRVGERKGWAITEAGKNLLVRN